MHNEEACHNVHVRRYCVRFAREGIDAMLLPTELVENVALQKLRTGAFTKREECRDGSICPNKRACTYCHLKIDEEDEDEKAMEWPSLQQQQQQATTMSPPAPVASSKVILKKPKTATTPAPAAVVPKSAAEQFFGIVVDGYCFIKCYGWSVAVLKQLVAEVSAGLRSRGARAAVHSHGRVFLFPDPSDALTKKLITNENLLATIEQLNAIRKDGWQVVHTSFKLVGALWKATAEDVAFANECAKLCRASALDPVGADPSRVTLSHLVIVTGDNDHVTTFTTQSNHELRWLVDMNPSADPNVPLRRHARDMQRLLKFSAGLAKAAFSGDDKPSTAKSSPASPAASAKQAVDDTALIAAAKNKGNASLSKGDYNEALKAYDEALRHLKGTPDTTQRAQQMASIHSRKAECFLSKSTAHAACLAATAALNCDPNNTKAQRLKQEAEEMLFFEKKSKMTPTPVADTAAKPTSDRRGPLHVDPNAKGSADPGLRASALAQSGNTFFAQRKYDDAVSRYSDAIRELTSSTNGKTGSALADPRHFKDLSILYSNTAQCHIQRSMWIEAYAAAKNALRYDGNNEEAKLLLAQARESFSDPTYNILVNVDRVFNLAQTAFSEGDVVEAQEVTWQVMTMLLTKPWSEIKEASKRDGVPLSIWSRLSAARTLHAELFLQLRNWKSAHACVLSALDDDPNNITAKRILSQIESKLEK